MSHNHCARWNHCNFINKPGPCCSQYCHIIWIIGAVRASNVELTVENTSQTYFTMIWQLNREVVVFSERHERRGVEHIFYINEAKYLLLKEWLQSPISFKAETKGLETHGWKKLPTFVTEINSQEWLITHRHNATEDRRSCQILQHRWKASQRTETLVCQPMHWAETFLRLCPTIIGNVSVFCF